MKVSILQQKTAPGRGDGMQWPCGTLQHKPCSCSQHKECLLLVSASGCSRLKSRALILQHWFILALLPAPIPRQALGEGKQGDIDSVNFFLLKNRAATRKRKSVSDFFLSRLPSSLQPKLTFLWARANPQLFLTPQPQIRFHQKWNFEDEWPRTRWRTERKDGIHVTEWIYFGGERKRWIDIGRVRC